MRKLSKQAQIEWLQFRIMRLRQGLEWIGTNSDEYSIRKEALYTIEVDEKRELAQNSQHSAPNASPTGTLEKERAQDSHTPDDHKISKRKGRVRRPPV